MNKSWEKYKLSDIGSIVGGATPSTSKEVYYGGNIPWLTPKDLSSFHDRYIERGERNITEAGLNSCSAQLLPAGSVLFSSRAPIGYIAIAKNPIATNQGFKSIIPEPDKVDSLFLYYLLKYNKENIEALGSGTTFKEVSGATMKNIEVLIPPLAEQKRIAAILGALDDKIELNRRINANLEEQAKALYYKLCLEGCNDFDLCEFAEIYSGKSIKPQKSGLYPILGANGEIGRTNEFLFNDRLIYTGRVGTLGKIYRVENKRVWLSDNTLIIKPKIGYNFIYFALKNTDIHSYNVGSTQPLIRQSDIKGIKIFFPAFEILQNFEQISDTLFSQINSNNDQNTILAALRDTLLSKLMSDEIKYVL